MSGALRWSRDLTKRQDNALRDTAGKRLLRCGHYTNRQPLATTFGRKLYVCPEGCKGLQEPKR